jgi:excinuclease UvrABC nuclease subunit
MKESATNLEFEEAAKIRDEIRKLEASELEITLNPKVKKYSSKIKFIQKVDQQWVYRVQEHKKVRKNGSK